MELGFSRPSEDVNGDILEPANKRQRTDLEHVASTEPTVVSGAADIPVTHGVASGVSIASQVPPSSVVEVTSSKEDPTKSGDVTTIAATSARDVNMDAPQEENVTLVNKTFIWTPPSAANEVAVSVSTTITSATSPPVKQTDAVPGDLGKVDPAAAAEAVDGLRLIILFILAAGIVAAVGLSIFAANSVAGPLKDVETAMAEVERGRLDGHAPVVSTDEIGAVAEGFNRMLHGLRERELVKETFGKYVTPEIRDEILAGRISGDGELKEVTVLFADIRDFTPWVEATAPRDVVRDLNEYFTEMAEAIRAQHGLVLQFIGDEIEAVFGAPIASRDHAAMAVRAALDMRGRLRAWNARREAAGKPALRHGIGIHTGTVLAGNIGGAERLSYALVGDPVNLASRIQGLTKDFKVDILISEATRKSIDSGVTVEELPAVRVKGRAEEVNVYKVV